GRHVGRRGDHRQQAASEGDCNQVDRGTVSATARVAFRGADPECSCPRHQPQRVLRGQDCLEPPQSTQSYYRERRYVLDLVGSPELGRLRVVSSRRDVKLLKLLKFLTQRLVSGGVTTGSARVSIRRRSEVETVDSSVSTKRLLNQLQVIEKQVVS